MTAQDAPNGQPTSLENAPFLNGFHGIMRTGGLEPALARPQQGRQRDLVQPDGQDEYFPDDFFHGPKVAKAILSQQL